MPGGSNSDTTPLNVTDERNTQTETVAPPKLAQSVVRGSVRTLLLCRQNSSQVVKSAGGSAHNRYPSGAVAFGSWDQWCHLTIHACPVSMLVVGAASLDSLTDSATHWRKVQNDCDSPGESPVDLTQMYVLDTLSQALPLTPIRARADPVVGLRRLDLGRLHDDKCGFGGER